MNTLWFSYSSYSSKFAPFKKSEYQLLIASNIIWSKEHVSSLSDQWVLMHPRTWARAFRHVRESGQCQAATSKLSKNLDRTWKCCSWLGWLSHTFAVPGLLFVQPLPPSSIFTVQIFAYFLDWCLGNSCLSRRTDPRPLTIPHGQEWFHEIAQKTLQKHSDYQYTEKSGVFDWVEGVFVLIT